MVSALGFGTSFFEISRSNSERGQRISKNNFVDSTSNTIRKKNGSKDKTDNEK
jgi:hypothetical protein